MKKLQLHKFLVLTLIVSVIFAFASPALAQNEKININTASAQELAKLNRIGPAYAQRIIDYREANGPFKTPEDIMEVKGIGRKTFEANKDRITVE